MSLTLSKWHERYLQQAQWTKNLRTYLYQKCGLKNAMKVLDVGCGTGIMQQEVNNNYTAQTFGVDLDFYALKFAHQFAPKSSYTLANGLSLPYSAHTFDVAFCHFLLLWIAHPQALVEEMIRVTLPGGFLLAMAEPDYGGRIDYPAELSQIGQWQTESLKTQGANPSIGRQLRSIFSTARLLDIEVGVLGAQWNQLSAEQDFSLEWQVLESDLANNQQFKLQADKLKAFELNARRDLHRILFVPVFYALGRVGS